MYVCVYKLYLFYESGKFISFYSFFLNSFIKVFNSAFSNCIHGLNIMKERNK